MAVPGATAIQANGGVRMRKYRKLAEEYLAMALKAEDQRKRRALLELASECLDLAKNNARTG